MDHSEQEQQQLAWSQEIPNYGNKLLKRLDEFRKTTLYDVCVRTQNGDFNAHKVILAACGGIFRTCFVDEKRKMINDTPEITLNCPSQGLKPIIRFAYSGSLVVTKRNAVATMMAAEVINMKEVQKICAEIAIKEYGWVASYSGDKTPAIIEKLKKVLQIHSHCFVSPTSENEVLVNTQTTPFGEEVQNEISDYVTTYHQLVETLKNAELVVAARKDKNKENKVDKKNGTNDTPETATPAPTPTNPKPSEQKIDTAKAPAVNGRAPLPNQDDKISGKLSQTDDVTDSTTAIKDEANASDGSSKSMSIPPLKSATATENGSDNVPPEVAISKQPGASGVKSGDNATPTPLQALESVTPCGQDTKKNAVPIEESTTATDAVPTPPTRPVKTPRKDIPSPAPQNKSTSEVSDATGSGKSNGSTNEEDTSPNVLTTPRRDNIQAPSPKVKPRASMKLKKAPPPPPATAPSTATEKPTPEKPPAPRRTTKTPQKVPPPRPKPPVKKKATTDADVSVKVSTADEYDDSLNPFS